jgi:hypothetical protein
MLELVFSDSDDMLDGRAWVYNFRKFHAGFRS